MDSRDRRTRAAIDLIQRHDRMLVALSGGVDSATLLGLAADALGACKVLAVTAVSESLSADDLNDARAVATYLEVEHVELATDELSNPAYRANRGDRCFHCRDEMFEVLAELAHRRDYPVIAYGAIADDVGDERPGMVAAARHGILSPLLDAGLNKDDVRSIAEERGLPVADKPAAACLASRLPVGTEVTAERLAQVHSAEKALRRLEFGQLRVRHHGSVARIELDPAAIARLADPELRKRVADAVRSAGFRYVALDLDGYRSGSLNLVESPGRRSRQNGQ